MNHFLLLIHFNDIEVGYHMIVKKPEGEKAVSDARAFSLEVGRLKYEIFITIEMFDGFRYSPGVIDIGACI